MCNRFCKKKLGEGWQMKNGGGGLGVIPQENLKIAN